MKVQIFNIELTPDGRIASLKEVTDTISSGQSISDTISTTPYSEDTKTDNTTITKRKTKQEKQKLFFAILNSIKYFLMMVLFSFAFCLFFDKSIKWFSLYELVSTIDYSQNTGEKIAEAEYSQRQLDNLAQTDKFFKTFKSCSMHDIITLFLLNTLMVILIIFCVILTFRSWCQSDNPKRKDLR